MDKKTTGIVAYLTWIGLVIAFVAGDKEGAKFHLNQALVILLFSLLSVIPCIGWLWGIFMIVCWVMGLIAAINEEEKPVPLLGGIKLLK
ncbi:hypothetical protein [Lachnoclostridium sp. An138]|uniref:hypothetical protein n=1 Tax=Lachnoclostridium sp. An138 TaxID=1965560 RepID=UPI000B3A407D|nr:hypothetical protein [Lachnoclostridium sp. An138]OUQ13328.1 hypothetical protein B5E82_17510 [Lachnoclostridium sp. An138]